MKLLKKCLTGFFVALGFAVLMTLSLHASANNSDHDSAAERLALLEKKVGGRLGVYALNIQTGQRIEYRAHELFPMCSTVKVMGVAAILKKAEKDPQLMQKSIRINPSDLVSWSPLTRQHVGETLTIHDLGRAAITKSDSTAINLLIRELGGPAAVSAFARSILLPHHISHIFSPASGNL